jgi:cysteine-rich repeat protein
VQAGVEDCDDAGESASCNADCSDASCGDGIVNVSASEQCDDANASNTDMCLNSCDTASCGDGFVQGGVEECDDGNNVDNDDCGNDCISNVCMPLGVRAPLNSLGNDTASGCWSGNPCAYDTWAWDPARGQNFQNFNEGITCSGASTCVANVGIVTYSSPQVCQGKWEVLCDGVLVGTIDSYGLGCTGSAMNNNCRTTFLPRQCASIRLVAVQDNNATTGCCGGNNPDTMITGVSAL